MPLVLSIKEGEFFTANGAKFTVENVDPDMRTFDLIGPDGKLHQIDDTFAKMVMKDMTVSCGDGCQVGTASVVINAPRSIVILRDQK